MSDDSHPKLVERSDEQSEEDDREQTERDAAAVAAGESDKLGGVIAKWNDEKRLLAATSTKAHEYGEIVLWHRTVDVNLTEAIRGNFIANTKGAADALLVFPGVLTSFSARVHLGRCMGIFGEITFADLKIINDVRNRFAHPKGEKSGQLELFGFDHPWIIAECEKLKFLSVSTVASDITPPTDARSMYRQTTDAIASVLWFQHIVPPGLFDGTHPPWNNVRLLP